MAYENRQGLHCTKAQKYWLRFKRGCFKRGSNFVCAKWFIGAHSGSKGFKELTGAKKGLLGLKGLAWRALLTKSKCEAPGLKS